MNNDTKSPECPCESLARRPAPDCPIHGVAPVAGEKREGIQLPPRPNAELVDMENAWSKGGAVFEETKRWDKRTIQLAYAIQQRQLVDALRRATEAEGQLAEALAKVSRLSEYILALEQNMQGAAKDYEVSVKAYKDRIAELEMDIRESLWMGHGHRGQYGDDGEMQCNMCNRFGESDYRRGSLDDLRATVRAVQMARLAEGSETK